MAGFPGEDPALRADPGGIVGFLGDGGPAGFLPVGGIVGFAPDGGTAGFLPEGGFAGFAPAAGAAGFVPFGGPLGFLVPGGMGGFLTPGVSVLSEPEAGVDFPESDVRSSDDFPLPGTVWSCSLMGSMQTLFEAATHSTNALRFTRYLRGLIRTR